MKEIAVVGAICSEACRFAVLVEADAGEPVLSRYGEFPVGDYADVHSTLAAYRAQIGGRLPRILALGVAAPVVGDLLSLPQSGWSFSQEALKAAFGFDRVLVVNDIAAAGTALGFGDFVEAAPIGGSVMPAAPLVDGRYSLISLDQGLGVSAVVVDGNRSRIIDTEGGHRTFAAETDLEVRVFSELARVHGRVSYERVLSWTALSDLHAILAGHSLDADTRLSPLEVVLYGRADADPVCAQALDCYARILGGFAGDVALGLGSKQGVFLTGRFIFEAADYLDWRGFRERFENKGRLSHLLAKLPTWALTGRDSILVGVARRLQIELARTAPPDTVAGLVYPTIGFQPPPADTSEHLAGELMASAAVGFLVLDAELRIIAGNPQFWRGSTAPQNVRAPGQHVSEAFRAMADGGAWPSEAAATALARLERGEPYVLQRGGTGGLMLRDQARRAPSGRWIITSQNITRLARRACELAGLTTELREARNAAEAANRAKSAFLATMSHEIRTPLNGVLGMVQVLAHEELCPQKSERLGVIRQSGELLLAILNDILDLSKIEAGQLTLEMVEFDAVQLLRGAHAAFSGVAQTKNVGLALDVEGAEAALYRGDPTRLRQIVYNIVSNALKFTDTGEVRISTEQKPDGLNLTITDTGIGIDPAHQAALFGRFVQADSSTTRRFGGTGLGLAICRELSELMGGTIEVESAVGTGSTFKVWAPMTRIEDAGRTPAADPAPGGSDALRGGLKVLAADDHPVNRLVLKTLLQQVGVDPMIVEDGRQVVEAWEAQAWDLVLMDIQMPEMDGLAATAAIRAREAELARPRIPIIALTANAMAHQVEDYRRAGMDGHVAKPIQMGELIAAIAAVSQVDEAAPAPRRRKRAG